MCVSVEIFWFKNLEMHTFQYVYLYLRNFRQWLPVACMFRIDWFFMLS